MDVLGISRDQQKNLFERLSGESGGSILPILRSALSASAASVLMLFLIPVYSVLILYYRHQWIHILYRIFPGERQESLQEILSLTIQTYYNFIKGMAIVYLAVGILNSAGLWLLGVPHPLLFGFVASILTFIPYVGIIAGSLLPIAMAWITYDSIWYPLGVIGIFSFVQYLEANVIFPLAVSSRLKSKFHEYSQEPLDAGLSGKEVAERMLADNGIYDVQVTSAQGFLSDHYNPANKTVNLSPDVYAGRSIASVAVAAHECGHAVQHATAIK